MCTRRSRTPVTSKPGDRETGRPPGLRTAEKRRLGGAFGGSFWGGPDWQSHGVWTESYFSFFSYGCGSWHRKTRVFQPSDMNGRDDLTWSTYREVGAPGFGPVPEWKREVRRRSGCPSGVCPFAPYYPPQTRDKLKNIHLQMCCRGLFIHSLEDFTVELSPNTVCTKMVFQVLKHRFPTPAELNTLNGSPEVTSSPPCLVMSGMAARVVSAENSEGPR